MKSFREKYPGLTEEQLRIKYKIWERERERERQINEAEQKKRYRNPFKEDDEGDEGAGYSGSLDIDGTHGVVSDAALVSSSVVFYSNTGSKIFTKSDIEGRFNVPRSFGQGFVLVEGGIDSVNGIDYKGQFRIDSSFFHKYRAITPITHIASHIWDCTPTRTPEEAMNLVIDHISHLTNIKIPKINKDQIFNQDHVKLTLDLIEGSKEIQAINTIIEIYSDLIGSLKSNTEGEIIPNKIQTYKEIGNSLLTKINGQVSISYMEDFFKFHLSNQEKVHEKCCSFLINKAIKSIDKALCKDHIQATKEIQALNLAVKTEWCNKSLHMTADKNVSPNKIWDSIDKKNPMDLIGLINISDTVTDGGLSL
jgi:hypothetical protein